MFAWPDVSDILVCLFSKNTGMLMISVIFNKCPKSGLHGKCFMLGLSREEHSLMELNASLPEACFWSHTSEDWIEFSQTLCGFLTPAFLLFLFCICKVLELQSSNLFAMTKITQLGWLTGPKCLSHSGYWKSRKWYWLIWISLGISAFLGMQRTRFSLWILLPVFSFLAPLYDFIKHWWPP